MGLELYAISSPRGGRRTWKENMGLELYAMSSPRGGRRTEKDYIDLNSMQCRLQGEEGGQRKIKWV
jgi:hypothetical protein